MRCYFMRGGHIAAVEELPGQADEDAIAKAHALFSERKDLFEGFLGIERPRAYPASHASRIKESLRLTASRDFKTLSGLAPLDGWLIQAVGAPQAVAQGLDRQSSLCLSSCSPLAPIR